MLLASTFCGVTRAEAQEEPPAGQATAIGETRPPVTPLLDAPINRQEYLLGPGDIVDISIFGELARLHRVAITPEGRAVIPGLGVAEVLGLNLDDAENRVKSLVSRFYRNVEVHLSLAEVRQFKVFLVGNVPQPGVRTASAVTRVSEVVAAAGLNGVVHRNILLRRGAGDTVRVDLARFLQTGDLSANPMLREGDVLNVPMVDETVQVFGRVFFPGVYEYRSAESVAGLLTIVNGAGDFPANAADTIRLTRFIGPEQREFHVFSQADARGPRGQSFLLQPFDAIYIAELSNFKEQQTATIGGEVLRPGTYPIRPDTTTVRELVALAGGFTPEASLINATLRRGLPGTTGTIAEELERVPAELLSPEERQILRIRSQANVANVVIDFRDLLSQGEDAYAQTLRSGDVLSVPATRDEVVVLGAVREPGIVPFAAGQSPAHFVSRAGGFSRLAQRDETVVLRSGQDTRVAAADVAAIEPGDVIVVPFRERRNWLQILQTTGTIVTTVTGLVLSFIAISR